MSDNAKGILFASTTALLWAFLPIALKFGLTYADTISIVWIRFVVAFVLMAGAYAIRRPQDLRALLKPPVLMLSAGIGLGSNYLGYMKGLELTGPENAQILIQSAPLMFALSGVIFFKERLNRLQLAGVGLATLGFVLFYRELLTDILTDGRSFQIGSLWIIFGAIGWAAYAAFNKRLVQKTWQPQQVNIVVYFVSMLMFAPLADYQALSSLSLPGWGWMLFLGLNTLVAYGCFGEAVKYISAPKVSIIITLNPIITLFVMALLSNFQINWIEARSITLSGYLGAACVIGGAILVASRKKPNKTT